MRSVSSSCLTRVVVDGDLELEVAQLESVMQQIQVSLRGVPAAQRTYIGNALLNLAVCRMLGDEGNARTACILSRLSDAVAAGNSPPTASHVVDLTGFQS